MNDLITRVESIVGRSLPEATESGKWLTWEQIGSRGVMDLWIDRLKEAGIPAFFKAGDRKWGVLAPKGE